MRRSGSARPRLRQELSVALSVFLDGAAVVAAGRRGGWMDSWIETCLALSPARSVQGGSAACGLGRGE